MKDKIYSEYREKVADFVFDEKVAGVFEDMISRSVPGYAAIAGMTKVFAEKYAQADSVCYDLGCSLGACTLAMRKGIDKPNCRIVAVDNSAAMVARCRANVAKDPQGPPVDVVEADVRDVKIENASVVVMNFTLQFLPPADRSALIQRICDGMLEGGVLILSEKIAFDDPGRQAFETDMHHEFKKLMGYSDLEVAQKRRALENVMVPEPLQTHRDRLLNAGFSRTYLWFQCFNFMSLAAFR